MGRGREELLLPSVGTEGRGTVEEEEEAEDDGRVVPDTGVNDTLLFGLSVLLRGVVVCV